MMVDRVALYWHVPSPGHPIPVGVHPFLVEESIPDHKEISWAVRMIFLNRFSGLSGMLKEHPRKWLHKAMWDDTLDFTNWKKVVTILQAEFRDGTMDEESNRHKFVLITKENRRDFRGIGLVEVLWKAVTNLLEKRLTADITLHDILHGFWAVRGMGTDAIEAKLLQ